MSSYAIRADVSKNRLYVTLNGFMSDDELFKAVEVMIKEIKKLKPGFSTINDISTFKPATQKGAEEIQRGQLFAKQSGIGRVIRVVGANGLASMQFSRLTKSSGYGVDEAGTVEEAEKMLDKN